MLRGRGACAHPPRAGGAETGDEARGGGRVIPDDPELRRALDERSGGPLPDFGTRLGATLRAGRPRSNLMPAVAAVVVIALCAATIGALVYTRHAASLVGAASRPRLTSSPSPAPPATALQVSAPSASVVWALVDYARLFVSTNGGARWQLRPLPQQLGVRPAISFIDANEGWLL